MGREVVLPGKRKELGRWGIWKIAVGGVENPYILKGQGGVRAGKGVKGTKKRTKKKRKHKQIRE